MRISGVTYVEHKPRTAKKILLVLLMLFLTATLSTLTISAYQAWKLVTPPIQEVSPFSSNIVPEYRDVSFRSRDEDILLSAWLFPAGDSDKTVILAHSYGHNRLQFGEKTLEIVKHFIKRGYNVLTFDFRNSGKSEGKITSLGFHETQDLLGAIDYVKSRGDKHIVLMGFGTGAAASILAAAEDGDVSAVIADSSYSELRNFTDSWLSTTTKLPAIPFNKAVSTFTGFMAGMKVDHVSPIASIEKMSGPPILFIHGKDDTIIPVENSQKLYNTYSKNTVSMAHIWMVDRSDHLESYTNNPDQYLIKIVSFLDKVIE